MTLNEIGLRLNADKSSRFHDYLDFYESMLPGRDFEGRLLEIGIMDGLSMRMWREYYPKAEIVGVDIFNKDHLYNSDWNVPADIKLLELDATKKKDMQSLGKFDIILDDGSHMTADQQKSFDILYKDHLTKDGFYIIEDLWTSHMKEYVNSKVTTIDWLDKKHEKGLFIAMFTHKHDGIENIFPEYKGLDSQTAVIPGGQKL